MQEKEKYSFDDLLEVIACLRSENGCPWDKVQTHESLLQYLLEESYEVIDAVKKGDKDGMCEELGDVLLQVVLHSQIATESKEFTIDDVIDGVTKKMISRHEHVFGDISIKTEEELMKNWEKIKKKEKGYETAYDAISSIPECLPALLRAYKLNKKAAKYGHSVDYDDTMESINRSISNIETNIGNVKDDNSNSNLNKNVEQDYKKLLSSVVEIGNILKLNPEMLLADSCDEFVENYKTHNE